MVGLLAQASQRQVWSGQWVGPRGEGRGRSHFRRRFAYRLAAVRCARADSCSPENVTSAATPPSPEANLQRPGIQRQRRKVSAETCGFFLARALPASSRRSPRNAFPQRPREGRAPSARPTSAQRLCDTQGPGLNFSSIQGVV